MKRIEIRQVINDFLSGLSFITILPVPVKFEFRPGPMIKFFPLVGLFLGFLVALVDFAAIRLWNGSVAGIIDVIFLCVLTGGLHLDGLADSADGMLAHHSTDRALEIMKDSRVGAMGLIAVLMCIILKTGAVGLIENHRFLSIMLVPAYSRGLMLFGFYFFSYGREKGTGHAFFQEKQDAGLFSGMALIVLLSFFLGMGFIILNCGFILLGLLITWFYKKRLGIITGDMLGAMVETGEAFLFLFLAARWPL